MDASGNHRRYSFDVIPDTKVSVKAEIDEDSDSDLTSPIVLRLSPIDHEGQEEINVFPTAGERAYPVPLCTSTPRTASHDESPPGGQSARNRILFTAEQLFSLRNVFNKNKYPSIEIRERLARDLGMTHKSVKQWFQNARSKVKKRGTDHVTGFYAKKLAAKQKLVMSGQLTADQPYGRFKIQSATSPPQQMHPGVPFHIPMLTPNNNGTRPNPSQFPGPSTYPGLPFHVPIPTLSNLGTRPTPNQIPDPSTMKLFTRLPTANTSPTPVEPSANNSMKLNTRVQNPGQITSDSSSDSKRDGRPQKRSRRNSSVTSSSSVSPLPPANRTSPQLPSANRTSSQLPQANRTSPHLPQANRTSPQQNMGNPTRSSSPEVNSTDSESESPRTESASPPSSSEDTFQPMRQMALPADHPFYKFASANFVQTRSDDNDNEVQKKRPYRKSPTNNQWYTQPSTKRTQEDTPEPIPAKRMKTEKPVSPITIQPIEIKPIKHHVTPAVPFGGSGAFRPFSKPFHVVHPVSTPKQEDSQPLDLSVKKTTKSSEPSVSKPAAPAPWYNPMAAMMAGSAYPYPYPMPYGYPYYPMGMMPMPFPTTSW